MSTCLKTLKLYEVQDTSALLPILSQRAAECPTPCSWSRCRVSLGSLSMHQEHAFMPSYCRLHMICPFSFLSSLIMLFADMCHRMPEHLPPFIQNTSSKGQWQQGNTLKASAPGHRSQPLRAWRGRTRKANSATRELVSSSLRHIYDRKSLKPLSIRSDMPSLHHHLKIKGSFTWLTQMTGARKLVIKKCRLSALAWQWMHHRIFAKSSHCSGLLHSVPLGISSSIWDSLSSLTNKLFTHQQ